MTFQNGHTDVFWGVKMFLDKPNWTCPYILLVWAWPGFGVSSRDPIPSPPQLAGWPQVQLARASGPHRQVRAQTLLSGRPKIQKARGAWGVGGPAGVGGASWVCAKSWEVAHRRLLLKKCALWHFEHSTKKYKLHLFALMGNAQFFMSAHQRLLLKIVHLERVNNCRWVHTIGLLSKVYTWDSPQFFISARHRLLLNSVHLQENPQFSMSAHQNFFSNFVHLKRVPSSWWVHTKGCFSKVCTYSETLPTSSTHYMVMMTVSSIFWLSSVRPFLIKIGKMQLALFY